jgi:glycosyltransferase involved in cell wall biosynthesis
MKIAIITNLIPNYQRGFYELLLREENLDLTIFCQSHLPGLNIRPIQRELGCRLVEIPFWGLAREKFTWQWLPILQLWREFDVYVFYGNPRVLSNVVWATLFALSGKRVIIWGQGHTAGASRATEWLRLQWWRLFDYILVYTDYEADHLEQHGFGQKIVIGVNNGLDQNRIEVATSRWDAERLRLWRTQQGILGKTILLSCARLDPKNRFDLIIRALPQLGQRFPDLLWCVIGSNDLRESLEAQAEAIGVANRIRWLGAIYEEDDLAPWFLSSKVLVHPGTIGLTLMHAFGYSLPVITHDNFANQMPEIAALEDGINGFLFKEEDVASLCEKITTVLENEEIRQTLGKNGLELVRTRFNTQVMVKRFLEIVGATSK